MLDTDGPSTVDLGKYIIYKVLNIEKNEKKYTKIHVPNKLKKRKIKEIFKKNLCKLAHKEYRNH